MWLFKNTILPLKGFLTLLLPPWLTAVELFHLRRFPKHIMVYKLISYFVACYIGTLSWYVQGIKSIGSYKIDTIEGDSSLFI